MNLRNRNSSSKALSPDPPERGGDTADPGNAISDELNLRRLRRRLLELAAVGVLAAVVVLTGPGLGDTSQVARVSPGWLLLGIRLEGLSAPALGVFVLGYLIGQLGGNLPVPGGIGGVDAGLIGTFLLYHQPLAATTAAVLVYQVIALWVPGLLGSIAFVQLRRTLQRETRPAAVCSPLAEPIEAVPQLAGVVG